MIMEDFEILENKVKIRQKIDGFRFGKDALLLSKFFKEKKKGRILDIGGGTGILSFQLSSNEKLTEIDCIEIQKNMGEMIRETVIENNLEGKINVIIGDVKELKKGNHYDYIITNPPYMKKEGGKINKNSMKAISRHEIFLTLEELISESKRLLKDGGSLTMIYRVDRMVELLSLLKEKGFYVYRLQNIFTENNNKAKLVMLEAIKGKDRGFELVKPIMD